MRRISTRGGRLIGPGHATAFTAVVVLAVVAGTPSARLGPLVEAAPALSGVRRANTLSNEIPTYGLNDELIVSGTGLKDALPNNAITLRALNDDGETYSVTGAACYAIPTNDTETDIRCSSPIGRGKGLKWSVQIAGAGASGQLVGATVDRYTPPSVSSLRRPGTGAEPVSLVCESGATSDCVFEMVGSNHGPVGSTPAVEYSCDAVECPSYAASSCSVTRNDAGGATTSCSVVVGGVGPDFYVYMDVAGQAASRRGTLSYAQPVVDSVSGASSLSTAGGDTFTLTGQHFGTSGSSLVVKYGTSLQHTATAVSVLSVTTLTAKTVAGVGKGFKFTVEPVGCNGQFSCTSPELSSLTASYAPPSASWAVVGGGSTLATDGSDQIRFTGANLGPSTSSLSVTLVSGLSFVSTSAQSCTMTIAHSTITCSTPEGAGTGLQWQVSVGGQAASIAPTIDYAAPIVTSIGGSIGLLAAAGGTFFSLTGTNFGPRAGANEIVVDIGGFTSGPTACEVTTSHTRIECDNAPAGRGKNLPLAVTVSGQTSVTIFQGSYRAPSVSSILPYASNGAAITRVTISGSDFYTVADTVSLGSSVLGCTPVTWTDSSITCNMPAFVDDDAGTFTSRVQAITVSTAGQASNANVLFYYPKLTAVTPTFASQMGGSLITLTGDAIPSVPSNGDYQFALRYSSSTARSMTGTEDYEAEIGVAGLQFRLSETYEQPAWGPSGDGDEQEPLPNYDPLGSVVPMEVSFDGRTSWVSIPSPVTFYPPPTITDRVPASGPVAGGNALVVSGLFFHTGIALIRLSGSLVADPCEVTEFLPETPTIATRLDCHAPQATSAESLATLEVTVDPLSMTERRWFRNNSLTYQFYWPPLATRFDPPLGPMQGGTRIRIHGYGIALTEDDIIVEVDGALASGCVVSSTSTTKPPPTHSPFGNIPLDVDPAGDSYVTCSGVPSSATERTSSTVTLYLNGQDAEVSDLPRYTWYAHPTLTSITPSFGPRLSGTTSFTLTASGGGLSSAWPDLLRIRFDGPGSPDKELLEFDTITDTQVSGETTGFPRTGTTTTTVQVSLNAQDYSPSDVQFQFYDNPYVTSISPPLGPTGGGTVVTLHGQFAFDTGLVRLMASGYWSDSVTCQRQDAVSATCTVPASAAGVGFAPLQVSIDTADTREQYWTPATTSTLKRNKDLFFHSPDMPAVAMTPTNGDAQGFTRVAVVLDAGDALAGEWAPNELNIHYAFGAQFEQLDDDESDAVRRLPLNVPVPVEEPLLTEHLQLRLVVNEFPVLFCDENQGHIPLLDSDLATPLQYFVEDCRPVTGAGWAATLMVLVPAHDGAIASRDLFYSRRLQADASLPAASKLAVMPAMYSTTMNPSQGYSQADARSAWVLPAPSIEAAAAAGDSGEPAPNAGEGYAGENTFGFLYQRGGDADTELLSRASAQDALLARLQTPFRLAADARAGAEIVVGLPRYALPSGLPTPGNGITLSSQISLGTVVVVTSLPEITYTPTGWPSGDVVTVTITGPVDTRTVQDSQNPPDWVLERKWRPTLTIETHQVVQSRACAFAWDGPDGGSLPGGKELRLQLDRASGTVTASVESCQVAVSAWTAEHAQDSIVSNTAAVGEDAWRDKHIFVGGLAPRDDGTLRRVVDHVLPRVDGSIYPASGSGGAPSSVSLAAVTTSKYWRLSLSSPAERLGSPASHPIRVLLNDQNPSLIAQDAGQWSNPVASFQYTTSPTVDSVSPRIGPGVRSFEIAVSGSDFLLNDNVQLTMRLTQDAASVEPGATATVLDAPCAVDSTTRVRCTVPPLPSDVVPSDPVAFHLGLTYNGLDSEIVSFPGTDVALFVPTGVTFEPKGGIAEVPPRVTIDVRSIAAAAQVPTAQGLLGVFVSFNDDDEAGGGTGDGSDAVAAEIIGTPAVDAYLMPVSVTVQMPTAQRGGLATIWLSLDKDKPDQRFPLPDPFGFSSSNSVEARPRAGPLPSRLSVDKTTVTLFADGLSMAVQPMVNVSGEGQWGLMENARVLDAVELLETNYEYSSAPLALMDSTNTSARVQCLYTKQDLLDLNAVREGDTIKGLALRALAPPQVSWQSLVVSVAWRPSTTAQLGDANFDTQGADLEVVADYGFVPFSTWTEYATDGWLSMTFRTPLTWDGESSLIVDIRRSVPPGLGAALSGELMWRETLFKRSIVQTGGSAPVAGTYLLAMRVLLSHPVVRADMPLGVFEIRGAENVFEMFDMALSTDGGQNQALLAAGADGPQQFRLYRDSIQLSLITPDSGPTSGGTKVDLYGSGFFNTNAVVVRWVFDRSNPFRYFYLRTEAVFDGTPSQTKYYTMSPPLFMDLEFGFLRVRVDISFNGGQAWHRRKLYDYYEVPSVSVVQVKDNPGSPLVSPMQGDVLLRILAFNVVLDASNTRVKFAPSQPLVNVSRQPETEVIPLFPAGEPEGFKKELVFDVRTPAFPAMMTEIQLTNNRQQYHGNLSAPYMLQFMDCPYGSAAADYFRECEPCGPGTFASGSTCTRCSMYSYQPYEAGAFCESCPLNSKTAPRSARSARTDCECYGGYFALSTNWTECKRCPPYARCNGAWLPPQANVGWWRSPECDSDEAQPQSSCEHGIFRCSPVAACPSTPNGTCAVGYSGYICGDCAIGYHRVSKYCVPKPETPVWESLVALVFFVIILIGYNKYTYSTVLGSFFVMAQFAQSMMLLSYAELWSEPTGTVAMAKGQFFGQWPSAYQAGFEVFARYVAPFFYYPNFFLHILDEEERAGELRVHEHMEVVAIALAVQLMFVSMLGAIDFVQWHLFKRSATQLSQMGGRDESAKGGRAIGPLHRVSSALLVVLDLNFVFVAIHVIRLIMFTLQPDGTYTLDVAPSQRSSGTYARPELYAVILYMLLLFGVYLSPFYNSKKTKPYVSALFKRFRKGKKRWGAVILLRSVVTIIVVFVVPKIVISQDEVVAYQAYFGLGVTLTSALAHLYVQPYKYHWTNALEFAGLSAIFALYVVGMVFNIAKEPGELYAANAFPSDEVASLVELLGFFTPFGVACAALLIIPREIVARYTTLRLRLTQLFSSHRNARLHHGDRLITPDAGELKACMYMVVPAEEKLKSGDVVLLKLNVQHRAVYIVREVLRVVGPPLPNGVGAGSAMEREMSQVAKPTRCELLGAWLKAKLGCCSKHKRALKDTPVMSAVDFAAAQTKTNPMAKRAGKVNLAHGDPAFKAIILSKDAPDRQSPPDPAPFIAWRSTAPRRPRDEVWPLCDWAGPLDDLPLLQFQVFHLRFNAPLESLNLIHIRDILVRHSFLVHRLEVAKRSLVRFWFFRKKKQLQTRYKIKTSSHKQVLKEAKAGAGGGGSDGESGAGGGGRDGATRVLSPLMRASSNVSVGSSAGASDVGSGVDSDDATSSDSETEDGASTATSAGLATPRKATASSRNGGRSRGGRGSGKHSASPSKRGASFKGLPSFRRGNSNASKVKSEERKFKAGRKLLKRAMKRIQQTWGSTLWDVTEELGLMRGIKEWMWVRGEVSSVERGRNRINLAKAKAPLNTQALLHGDGDGMISVGYDGSMTRLDAIAKGDGSGGALSKSETTVMDRLVDQVLEAPEDKGNNAKVVARLHYQFCRGDFHWVTERLLTEWRLSAAPSDSLVSAWAEAENVIKSYSDKWNVRIADVCKPKTATIIGEVSSEVKEALEADKLLLPKEGSRDDYFVAVTDGIGRDVHADVVSPESIGLVAVMFTRAGDVMKRADNVTCSVTRYMSDSYRLAVTVKPWPDGVPPRKRRPCVAFFVFGHEVTRMPVEFGDYSGGTRFDTHGRQRRFPGLTA